MHPSTLAKRGTVLIFLASAAFYFYGLGHFPLLGPDEPRYAQVAREMFLRHDWISPTLGGQLWFEKPALLYWMMIAGYKLFGVSEGAARLPAAVSGLLTIVAVYCLSRSIGGSSADEKSHDYAFWSVFVSATTLGLVVFSRAASFDIVLTMTTTWALTFYFLHDVERNIKRLRLLLAGFYIFIGLALLAKGLIGMVIPVGVVGLFCLFQRRLPGRSTLISLLWGLPLTLLVAGAWYVPVIWRHGWPFIDQFFIQHHFARYLSNKYHHPRPIYYYLEIVPLLALPWSAFLIDGLLQSKLSLWRFSETGADKAEDRLKRLMVFALAWVLFPLVFFSFSRSKLPGYILPILPAVALIVGERLWRLSFVSGNEDSANSPARPRWPLKATAVLCLAFAAGTFAYGWRAGLLSLVCALSIALPLMGAGCFALFRTRRPAESVMLIAAATTAALIFALNCAAPAYAERDSSRRLLQLADARGYGQTPINGMQRSDRTPEFYASGRIVYEADGEPVMYEGPNRVVWESGQRRQSYLVFVPLEELNKLTEAAAAQTEVIGNNGRYAIVAVSPR